jgi:crotonobetainyl-CoA:carnitine CoA-transferase CaiB-like acyl-CoA transferase
MPLFAALQGVRVIDLTANVAGPFATQILGDLGADVIKVERPSGDDTRRFPPSWDDESVVFMAFNRNKRSLILDLKQTSDKEKLLSLIETADVFVESYSAGKAKTMGLSYEDVRARRERIVYCSVSAFGNGATGAQIPGYDPIIQAFCGIMSTTGHSGNPPTRVAASLIDLSTGMWAAIGILAALSERARTGVGQEVGATLIDSGYNLMCHQILGFLSTGEVPQQLGSASPITAPYEAFRCADGWVMIAAGNDDLFARLCGALDLEAVRADPRFSTVHGRTLARDELHAMLEERLEQDSVEHWIDAIRRARVPIGPVHRIDEAVAHPIVEERQLLVEPVGGSPDHRLLRLPLTSDGENAPSPNAPPRLGEHTESVLAELGHHGSERSNGHGGQSDSSGTPTRTRS